MYRTKRNILPLACFLTSYAKFQTFPTAGVSWRSLTGDCHFSLCTGKPSCFGQVECWPFMSYRELCSGDCAGRWQVVLSRFSNASVVLFIILNLFALLVEMAGNVAASTAELWPLLCVFYILMTWKSSSVLLFLCTQTSDFFSLKAWLLAVSVAFLCNVFGFWLILSERVTDAHWEGKSMLLGVGFPCKFFPIFITFLWALADYPWHILCH